MKERKGGQRYGDEHKGEDKLTRLEFLSARHILTELGTDRDPPSIT